ncbi:MAG: malto-oligosyltrehalose synthase, partial [Myxococcota bacterium]
MADAAHTPRATYRLQLRPDLGFDGVLELAGYLADLGVSHVYLSPCLRAVRGSTHGYDVVDPTRLDEALGGREAFDRMVRGLRDRGLGLVLDIVPNHLATATPDNAWWWTLLEHGAGGPGAPYFDVDWQAPDPRLAGKVLLAILGDHYGRVRSEGHIRVARHGDAVALRVYDRVLPLAPGSLDSLRRPDEPTDALISRINASPEDLDALLARQHYRLAYWRTARHELNYRRFFDIHDLAAVRVEDPRVFDAVHRLVLEMTRNGDVDGLRVDHPDGLRDPTGYFRRLRREAPDAWIVAEKILEMEEELPEAWPVDGTTGYEYLNRLTGVFVDPRGEPPLSELYARFTGEEPDFHAVSRRAKAEAMQELFGSEIERLARSVRAVCEKHPDHRDHTLPDIRSALFELAVAMPVYRTYVRPGEPPSAPDLRRIEAAVSEVRARAPQVDPVLLDLLTELLSGRMPGEAEDEVILLFQQATGPAMAKGLEDTAFYRHHRLLSANEVGGDPARFGTSVGDLHRFCARMQERWPSTMVATSTHDTKRSEDVRARIALLSEVPEAWTEAVQRWSALGQRYRRGPWPDQATEYLLYQTLVGAWPISRERLVNYALKATREAKVHTSWHRPDADYEQALRDFIEGLVDDGELVEDLERFLDPLVSVARVTSLSQVLLKLTVPGVPDIHQGNEVWRRSLVDPDNRRPVDFDERRRLLKALDGLSPEQVLDHEDEGMPKLSVIARALALRARRPECFGHESSYRPLEVEGPHAHRLIAFARTESVVTVAPRLLMSFDGDWRDTHLTIPPGPWRNVFTGDAVDGGRVSAAELLTRFPVALLER